MNALPPLHICLIHPPGYAHGDALLDPVLYFKHQFERFGLEVTFARNVLQHGGINFVFGAHSGFDIGLCKKYSCIFVNLEQIGAGGASLPRFYLNLLSRTAVVDYDAANPPAYTAFPRDVPIVRFGYAPYLANPDSIPLENRQIDLLFFGSMNPRRQTILERIAGTGRRITVAPSPLYGADRDALIRQAKAVVNLPYYESARFEQVRAFMCLSMGTPVLSERHASSHAPEIFEESVTWFDESTLDRLFGDEFGTPEFYASLHRQVEAFRRVDTIDDYAELVAFAAGVWQAHSQEQAGQTRDDFELRFAPAISIPAVLEEPLPDRTGREASTLFQYLDGVRDRIDGLVGSGDHEAALQSMAIAVHQHFCRDGVAHHALYYPEFDRQLERLSKLCTSGQPSETRRAGEADVTLIVATELFQVGGHTKVLEDVAREVKRPLVVLTDLFGSYDGDTQKADWIFEKFAGIEVAFLPSGTFWSKCEALRRLVESRSIANIVYFQHHQDPVAFVGTLEHSRSMKFLVHHGDHNPSLGCTLNKVRHVDVSTLLQTTCQAHLRRSVSLLPLYVPDSGRKPFSKIQGNRFSVVTSGRAGKFALGGTFALQRIASTVLSSIAGRFYVVGTLPNEWIVAIGKQLEHDGIDSDRFVVLGWVPSLWQKLLELDVSFYLGSAPVGGGRAAIEAQGAGLPTLYFKGADAGSLIENYTVYASSSLGWSSLDELTSLLPRLAPLAGRLSREARSFYEDHFSRQHFRSALAQLLGQETLIADPGVIFQNELETRQLCFEANHA